MPPELHAQSWDEMTAHQQALLVGYNQVREDEDAKYGSQH
jgi:hypothetical protein